MSRRKIPPEKWYAKEHIILGKSWCVWNTKKKRKRYRKINNLFS